MPWVTAAGAADVQQTTHVTSSPACEGTQREQAVPLPCSQACTAASTSQQGESPGTGIPALTTHLSCPCRGLALNRAARPPYVHVGAILAAKRGHADSKWGAMGLIPQAWSVAGCSPPGSHLPARLGQADQRYSRWQRDPISGQCTDKWHLGAGQRWPLLGGLPPSQRWCMVAQTGRSSSLVKRRDEAGGTDSARLR